MYRKIVSTRSRLETDKGEELFQAISQHEDDIEKLLQAKECKTSAELTEEFDKLILEHKHTADKFKEKLQLLVWKGEELLDFQRVRKDEVGYMNARGPLHHLKEKLQFFDTSLYSNIVETQAAKISTESFSTAHLNYSVSKPQVCISEGQSNNLLTPEMLSLIYSFCSLESCVALREVDSLCYSVFQREQDTMRSHLLARNPWIIPEDGLKWSDCALLFVTRLKSWTQVDSFDQLKLPTKLIEHKAVVARELQYGEKIAFKQQYEACWRLDQVRMDLNTLQGKVILHEEREDRGYDSDFENTENSDLEMLEHYGVKLTESQRSAFEDAEKGRFTVNVFLDETCDNFVFLQDKPHDPVTYKGGGGVEIGHLFVVRHDGHFLLADFDSSQMVEYSRGSEGSIFGYYNGLVWWDQEGCYIPTLKDVETGKIYSQEKRSIKTPLRFPGQDGRFVTGTASGFGHKFNIDLNTGINTFVVFPRDWGFGDERAIFWEYVDGKFLARCMTEETYSRYREEILDEFGVEWRRTNSF